MTLAGLLVSVGVGAFANVEDTPKAPPVPIAGTVVDADRRPAAGADVYFSLHHDGTSRGGFVTRTETDGQGRFHLEVPGAPGGGPVPGTVWAYRPGALVATRSITRDTPRDWPVSMVLDEPARAEFAIRGPDGRPVAGARIRIQAIVRESYEWVPGALAERIEARTLTDTHGRAVLTAVFPEEIYAGFISAPGLGRQYCGLLKFVGGQEVRAIDLLPVGRIEGRVVADDPEIVRNRKLTVAVWDAGLFDLRTDAQGRFAVPEAPAGELRVEGLPRAGSPWILQAPRDLKVEAGRTTRVEVKAVKGIRVRGLFRERDTGAPIAGVGLYLYRDQGSVDAVVRTDAEGRFTLYHLPGGGPPNIWVIAPEGYASPMFSLEYPEVPAGVAEFDLPARGLSRAGTVRGTVVDDHGEPVPGVKITASWPVNEGPRARGLNERHAVAGRRGEVRIERVDDESPVALSAVAPDGRRTTRAFGSRAGAEPVRLVLESSASVSLAGRVVDTTGHRVAGAKVHIRVQEHDDTGELCWNALVTIRGAYVIKTKDSGWFRTPMILDPQLKYAALVEADGYELAHTGWVAGKARTFPEVVLRPRAILDPAAVVSPVVHVDLIRRATP